MKYIPLITVLLIVTQSFALSKTNHSLIDTSKNHQGILTCNRDSSTYIKLIPKTSN